MLLRKVDHFLYKWLKGFWRKIEYKTFQSIPLESNTPYQSLNALVVRAQQLQDAGLGGFDEQAIQIFPIAWLAVEILLRHGHQGKLDKRNKNNFGR